MLKEKIGQMLLIGFKGSVLKPDDAIVRAILARQVGGVILFDYDFQTKTFDHNIQNPEQLKRLTQQLQHYATEAGFAPLFIGIDYEGGKVNRLKESQGFLETISAEEMARLSDQEIYQYAERMAKTLKTAGINLNFAPVVDININTNNPVIGKLNRSFSNDPQKVIECAALFSKAHYDHGVLSVYKHFPGHGSSAGDTHAGFVDITQTWEEGELDPYRELYCPAVMTAHVVHYGLDKKGYPASLSVAMTKELLREKLHFNGVVVTDDLQMKAITDKYGVADAVRLAVNAGADILVFGNQLSSELQDPHEIIEIIYADVQSGNIPESRIDEAYNRIINLKKHL